MNCCETHKDKSTPLREDSNYFKDFGNFVKVKDTWRLCNPDIIEYTYVDPSNRGYSSRIDYVLSSSLLSESIMYSEIIHAPVPDHNAVVTSFSVDHEKRGQGFGK